MLGERAKQTMLSKTSARFFFFQWKERQPAVGAGRLCEQLAGVGEMNLLLPFFYLPISELESLLEGFLVVEVFAVCVKFNVAVIVHSTLIRSWEELVRFRLS